MHFTSVSFRFVLLLFTVLINSAVLFSQKEYAKNPHVIYKVELNNSSYSVHYKFRDIFNNFQDYELMLPEEYTHEMISKFGVPKWLFEPYVDTESNRRIREKEINRGFFFLNGNTIEVNKSAVIDYYAPTFCKPIAEMIVSTLSDYGSDNRRNRIEMAIRLVQDIPYGVPTYEDEVMHYGGVSPPPKLLIDGFGDCDSKALLFVGILSYLIPAKDIVFLNQPEHVLSAVKASPEKGLTYIAYQQENYLIAETAGPGKRLLGEKGNYFRNKFKVEELVTDAPEPLAFTENKTARQTLKKQQAEEEKLQLNNATQKIFHFEMSYDNQNWKIFRLEPFQTGVFNVEEKQEIYIRFREKRTAYKNYKLFAGSSYTVQYNIRKKAWELLN
ncbi:MAG: hypothetical protein K9G76_09585 [Bacteroidales bacterium]|nr:hypothetical protein [Bacteroidales bacterium]MCF8403949.1 hypothetical protein [Bacteroidales bacterium]